MISLYIWNHNSKWRYNNHFCTTHRCRFILIIGQKQLWEYLTIIIKEYDQKETSCSFTVKLLSVHFNYDVHAKHPKSAGIFHHFFGSKQISYHPITVCKQSGQMIRCGLVKWVVFSSPFYSFKKCTMDMFSKLGIKGFVWKKLQL